MKRVLSFLAKWFEIIVLCVFFISLYALMQIRLDWFWSVGKVENYDAVNSIIEGLSYSYIAACFFYFLTVKLPSIRRKEKLKPIIRTRVDHIGNLIYDVLLEFSRKTNYSANIDDIEHTPDLLRSKNWDDEMPMIKQYRHISISYFRYTNEMSKQVRKCVSDIIIRYREDLSEDQIEALECFSNMLFFSTVNSLSSFPAMKVNEGVDSLIKEFVDMQKRFIEVSSLF